MSNHQVNMVVLEIGKAAETVIPSAASFRAEIANRARIAAAAAKALRIGPEVAEFEGIIRWFLTGSEHETFLVEYEKPDFSQEAQEEVVARMKAKGYEMFRHRPIDPLSNSNKIEWMVDGRESNSQLVRPEAEEGN